MTNPTIHTATVGAFEVTAKVYEAAGCFLIHVYEDGKHTGSVYNTNSEAARDSLVAGILGA